MQIFDRITLYPYSANARKVCKTNVTNETNLNNENKTKHNPKWSYIPDHPYRILVICGSGSGKINVLLNLISN